MSMIGAAIVSTLLSTGINAITNDITRRKGLASEANDTIRDYNELVRQQQERAGLFQSQTSTSYGNDFYSKLISGASTSELIGSIGANTALGKSLALKDRQAHLVVANAKTENQETYQVASMQAQNNLTNVLAQEIAGMQSSGQAAASQATSGIRSDRGTGGNLVEMQEQQNDLAMRNLQERIAMQNKQVMLDMQKTRRSASQQAEFYRKERDIDAQSAIERALNEYAGFMTDMRDMDTSQQNLKERVTDLTEEAGQYAKNVTEVYDEDTVSAYDFKFIDD